MSYYGATRNVPDHSNSLTSADVSLDVRQHPQNALVTPENKEKGRKPIDPPPIVQLKISNEKHRNWLVNPFLFMNAVLVGAERGPSDALKGNQLLGQNVSSLHRLKDVNNKDGGFFVFGDISCRRVGMFRLQFNLFNYEKEEVNYLDSVFSQPFRVMTAKEYPGLQESTHLSRTFSDQGVRLRLRKENRTGGVKRTFTAASEISEALEARNSSSVYSGGPVHLNPYDHADRSHAKRQRSDSDYTSSQLYPGYTHNSMQSYAAPLQNPYAQHPPPPQHNQQMQVGGVIPPTHPGTMTSLQRPPGFYSMSVGGGMSTSGGTYLGSGASPGETPRSMNDPHRSSAQYGERTPNDIYSGMTSLPTPSSEPSLGSAQSSIGAYSQSGHSVTALPAGGQPVQQYDMSNQSAQHYTHPGNYTSHAQGYSVSGGNPIYDQQASASTLKSEGADYGEQPSIYHSSSQHTYPGAEPFSSHDNPLSSGMLNREYPGMYQQPQQSQEQEPGGYSGMAGQDQHQGYQTKSQHPADYPTPHQTSPEQMREPG